MGTRAHHFFWTRATFSTRSFLPARRMRWHLILFILCAATSSRMPPSKRKVHLQQARDDLAVKRHAHLPASGDNDLNKDMDADEVDDGDVASGSSASGEQSSSLFDVGDHEVHGTRDDPVGL